MTSLDDKQYSFNWDNHMSHMRKALTALLNQNELIDVTLCCEDGKLSAHKMLLSMCSPYFRDIFVENPCHHPIVILKDVKFNIMRQLLQFMYDGEVTVEYYDFDTFIKTAEYLQISGLTEREVGMETPTEIEVSSAVQTSTDEIRTAENLKIEERIGLESNNLVQHLNNTEINIEDSKAIPLEYDIQELDIKKVEGLTEGKPTINALHLHRCFSSTAPTKEVKESTKDSGNQLYCCAICDKTFNHYKSYEHHKVVHDGQTKCPICGKVLSRKYQLMIHMQNQHGAKILYKEKKSEKVKNFTSLKCPECNKEYTHEKSLLQHTWMHKGRTKCHLCNKIFSRKYGLKVHLKNVHGE